MIKKKHGFSSVQISVAGPKKPDFSRVTARRSLAFEFTRPILAVEKPSFSSIVGGGI
jgi:hypothetical protein